MHKIRSFLQECLVEKKKHHLGRNKLKRKLRMHNGIYLKQEYTVKSNITFARHFQTQNIKACLIFFIREKLRRAYTGNSNEIIEIINHVTYWMPDYWLHFHLDFRYHRHYFRLLCYLLH